MPSPFLHAWIDGPDGARVCADCACSVQAPRATCPGPSSRYSRGEVEVRAAAVRVDDAGDARFRVHCDACGRAGREFARLERDAGAPVKRGLPSGVRALFICPDCVRAASAAVAVLSGAA